MLLRSFLLLALAVCVPFQAALAVTASQCLAMHQDQDDHHHGDSHKGTDQQSHCGPCAACCVSAAIAGALPRLFCSPSHGLAVAAPALPPLVPLLSGIDRPPRSL